MPTSPTPADLLRAALDRTADLHERFTGSTCGTCADADGQAAAWPCETASALAAARQLLGTSTAEGVTPSAAPLAGVWTVWAEDESTLGHYTDEVTAKLAAIEHHQETETPGLEFAYRWNEHGGRLELLADGGDTGLRVKHDPVYGALPAPADRAAVLREAADFVGNDDTCDCGGCDTCIPRRLADRLRALAADAAAGVQPPTEGEAKPPTHLPKGTNAEDCPACGPNPPYPFLCPGPPAAPAAPEEQR
ncbi:hypothetical protein [Streptomyces californicus]|uniref:hypothetical protein n=1 Tax=Streptomyces californicus TaxID=67351 RepID=UPI003320AF78